MKRPKKKKKKNEFFCICSENITCADLIGRQRASSEVDAGQQIIEWQSGFLLNAIEYGKCVVLDCLEEAPSTVTERLNSLLDKKYDGKYSIFNVYENPNNNEILIHDDFRLVCTCEIENIKKMSPAFINRFDVIVFENQLEGLNKNDLESFINFLFKNIKYKNNLYINEDDEEDIVPESAKTKIERN